MKIAIAGHGGFLGSSFMAANPDLEYLKLDRSLLYGTIDDLANHISGADVVINLAGASIWRPWTRKNRRKIIRSREEVNGNLIAALKKLGGRKPMLVAASATHIYSVRNGFLKRVAERWEAPLGERGKEMKVVIMRMAPVLGNRGGAFRVLRMVSRLGFTAVLGTGEQHFSFIHVEDWVKAVRYIIDRQPEGIYDLAAPCPVDYATFTRKLKKATGAPLMVRIPATLLRWTVGEVRTIVTDDQYVTPDRLISEGFQFRYPDMDSVLNNLLQ